MGPEAQHRHRSSSTKISKNNCVSKSVELELDQVRFVELSQPMKFSYLVKPENFSPTCVSDPERERSVNDSSASLTSSEVTSCFSTKGTREYSDTSSDSHEDSEALDITRRTTSDSRALGLQENSRSGTESSDCSRRSVSESHFDVCQDGNAATLSLKVRGTEGHSDKVASLPCFLS